MANISESRRRPPAGMTRRLKSNQAPDPRTPKKTTSISTWLWTKVADIAEIETAAVGWEKREKGCQNTHTKNLATL